MSGWFSTLVFLGFLGVIARLILPEGEKSKLYPPLRFLLSLLTVLTIFSPLFTIKQNNGSVVDLSSFFEVSETDSNEIERNLLQRSSETMYNNVKERFPDANFTLCIYTEEGSIPTEIAVLCEGAEGDDIANFLEENYKIKTTKYENGEYKNGPMAPR